MIGHGVHGNQNTEYKLLNHLNKSELEIAEIQNIKIKEFQVHFVKLCKTTKTTDSNNIWWPDYTLEVDDINFEEFQDDLNNMKNRNSPEIDTLTLSFQIFK